MADRRALITGITGQDGSYLAELLLEKGYDVSGMTRRASTENVERIGHLTDRISLIQGDLLDPHSLVSALRTAEPTEVHNSRAELRADLVEPAGADGGVHRRRRHEDPRGGSTVDPNIRFYQASSSEMYGKVREVPQTEQTPFHPRSPYGVAKAYGHYITVNYRSRTALRGLGDPVQPRVAPPGSRVRDAEDQRRRRPHQTRARGRAAARETWTPSGIGVTPATTLRPCG